MTAFLLDVNVLLALCDPRHEHHEAAHRWFSETGQAAWATCAITENGFVRVSSHPSYPNRPGDVQVVLTLLRQFCALDGHQFWSENVSLLDILSDSETVTHNQLTDVYLLGLAVHMGGKLATFDRNIPVAAVHGGPDALKLIKA